jgi:hypothetical protein
MISPFPVTVLGPGGCLPSRYSRTAGPDFDRSPKKFFFFAALELCFAPGHLNIRIGFWPNPLLQELPLWFLLGQRQSFLIRGLSLGCPAEPAVHIRTG